LVPRPRCGRSLLPYRTEWDLRSRTTPAQRPRRVISISRPSRPSHHQPVQDAPAGRRVSSCSCPCPQPTDRYPALDQLPCRPGGERDAAAAADPYRTGGRSAVDPVGARHSRTHDHPFPARPQFGAATTQPLADHRDISHPTRPDVGGPAAPTHARIQRCADSADAGATVTGGVSVRTPGSRRSRGHRSRWTPDVRPTQWTDVRPADSGRGQATNGVSGVRTSSTATATGGWAGPTPLGLPRRRRSAIHDGSAVTTPAAAAVTAAAPGSRTAPLGMGRRPCSPNCSVSTGRGTRPTGPAQNG
jgi:hypothetical protein